MRTDALRSGRTLLALTATWLASPRPGGGRVTAGGACPPVGGPPTYPQFAPAYPAPVTAPPPRNPTVKAPGSSVARAPQAAVRPVARGQKPDEPRPAPLVMPTPEELGIPVPKAASPAPAAVDWAAVHARLDRLGATAFALERAGQVYRFTCRLPADRTVEGRGATQAEAIRMALEQAERR